MSIKQTPKPKYEADPMTPVLFEVAYNKPCDRPQNYDIYGNTNFEKSKEYFHILPHEEPHSVRRRAILEKHPEIKQLYVKDPISGLLAVVIAVVQIVIAYYIQD